MRGQGSVRYGPGGRLKFSPCTDSATRGRTDVIPTTFSSPFFKSLETSIRDVNAAETLPPAC